MLSGLSLCQYFYRLDNHGSVVYEPFIDIVSSEETMVESVHPLYNVEFSKVAQMQEYFSLKT